MSSCGAKIWALAMACLLISGCASTVALGGDPKLSVLDASELPTPSRDDMTGGVQPYFVGPADKLLIDVYGIEELGEREIQVDAAGRISFPLAGVVEVSGKTPSEIEALLAERLAKAYVRNPQVTVNLKETLSRVVTVDGEVKKPGLYPVLGRMTLMRAVARAEGTGEFSRLDDVVIFRTVNGQRYAALYNLDAIRHGAYADPDVFANDVIMVGDSRSRRLFKDVLAILPAIATPLVIAIDRFSN